jgi:hypothetical protein
MPSPDQSTIKDGCDNGLGVRARGDRRLGWNYETADQNELITLTID